MIDTLQCTQIYIRALKYFICFKTLTNATAKTNVSTTAQTQRVHSNADVQLDTNLRMME